MHKHVGKKTISCLYHGLLGSITEQVVLFINVVHDSYTMSFEFVFSRKDTPAWRSAAMTLW